MTRVAQMTFKMMLVGLGIVTVMWIYAVALVATVGYPHGAPIRDWGYYGLHIYAQRLAERPDRYFTWNESDPDIDEAIAKLGQDVAVEHNPKFDFLALSSLHATENIQIGGVFYRIGHFYTDPPLSANTVTVTHIKAERLYAEPNLYFTLNDNEPDVKEALAKLDQWVAVEQPYKYNPNFMKLPRSEGEINVDIDGHYYKIREVVGIPVLGEERNPAVDLLLVTSALALASSWITIVIILRSRRKL